MQIKSYIAQGHRDRHTYVKAVIRNSELDTHVMMQIKLKIKVLSEKSQKQVRIRAKFCLSNSNTHKYYHHHASVRIQIHSSKRISRTYINYVEVGVHSWEKKWSEGGSTWTSDTALRTEKYEGLGAVHSTVVPLPTLHTSLGSSHPLPGLPVTTQIPLGSEFPSRLHCCTADVDS